MSNKQDNLRQFRGHLKREIRKRKEEARNAVEKEKMFEITDNIKIDCWLENDKKNNWMFIRLSFKKALIPNDFIPDVKIVLGELFHEHF